ncbi:hypothetical protein NDU88_001954 [Pleurodeles waltl]|uniref:Uncharacterized protein n=1 Tax=Pleurodeles waltl TaxID=8319 RepID=A0AAV7TJR6_PLEWA|nr:hypothetical protein NDU88_001954 [Pleurodeles waltl]
MSTGVSGPQHVHLSLMAGASSPSGQSLEMRSGISVGTAPKASEMPKKKPREPKEPKEPREPKEPKDLSTHGTIISIEVLADTDTSLVLCFSGGVEQGDKAEDEGGNKERCSTPWGGLTIEVCTQ